MNVQNHARTEQIKQLSGKLRRALGIAGFVLWLGWPLLVVMLTLLFSGSDKVTLMAVPTGSLSIPERLGVALFAAAALLLTQMAVRYTRLLMETFSQGRIFDLDAVRIARKAINCGLGLLAVKVTAEVATAVYTGRIQVPGPALTLFYGFLLFGLLHVMLWALEIGRDLQDESELTI
jgi:hypothetical protein